MILKRKNFGFKEGYQEAFKVADYRREQRGEKPLKGVRRWAQGPFPELTLGEREGLFGGSVKADNLINKK